MDVALPFVSRLCVGQVRLRDFVHPYANTRDQPDPAQVRHEPVTLRLPLPSHLGHAPAGCGTETVPFPPQTRHETMYDREIARLPVPAHCAHVSGAWSFCGWLIFHPPASNSDNWNRSCSPATPDRLYPLTSTSICSLTHANHRNCGRAAQCESYYMPPDIAPGLLSS